MQHNITVMSRGAAIEMSNTELDHDTVIVSITGFGEEFPEFADNPHIVGVCYVQFDDEEQGINAMTDDNAREILNFISEWASEDVDIVVHCSAGISRSAGVGAALMLILNGDDSDVFGSGKYAPNMNCYRKMLSAAGLGYSDEYFDKKEDDQYQLWLELAMENGLI